MKWFVSFVLAAVGYTCLCMLVPPARPPTPFGSWLIPVGALTVLIRISFEMTAADVHDTVWSGGFYLIIMYIAGPASLILLKFLILQFS
jgi:hypothetical protein